MSFLLQPFLDALRRTRITGLHHRTIVYNHSFPIDEYNSFVGTNELPIFYQQYAIISESDNNIVFFLSQAMSRKDDGLLKKDGGLLKKRGGVLPQTPWRFLKTSGCFRVMASS